MVFDPYMAESHGPQPPDLLCIAANNKLITTQKFFNVVSTQLLQQCISQRKIPTDISATFALAEGCTEMMVDKHVVDASLFLVENLSPPNQRQALSAGCETRDLI